MEAKVKEEHQQKVPNTDEKLSRFSCKICLEVAEQPVITPCGHLYCWQCIYKWASVKASCPFCNNKINVDKLTTIYTEADDTPFEQKKTNLPQENQATSGQNSSSSSSAENHGNNQSSNTQQEQSEGGAEIPHRPQNPRDEFDQQQQNINDNQFNMNFFGFPGMLFGGIGFGGLAFNLNGFQFGGGRHHVQGRGWQRYIGLIPLVIFFAQLLPAIFSSLFGYNEYEEIHTYRNPKTTTSKSNKKKTTEQSTKMNHEYQDYSYNSWSSYEYGELLAIFVLMILIFVLGKLRTR